VLSTISDRSNHAALTVTKKFRCKQKYPRVLLSLFRRFLYLFERVPVTGKAFFMTVIAMAYTIFHFIHVSSGTSSTQDLGADDFD